MFVGAHRHIHFSFEDYLTPVISLAADNLYKKDNIFYRAKFFYFRWNFSHFSLSEEAHFEIIYNFVWLKAVIVSLPKLEEEVESFFFSIRRKVTNWKAWEKVKVFNFVFEQKNKGAISLRCRRGDIIR
jgi:hypothetical protein